jgi:hypothetical protein
MDVQNEGGRIAVVGPEEKVLAGMAASATGGSVAIFNDLGIYRGLLHIQDDGGRLDLHWAGTPAVVLRADEAGGEITALDPQGGVRGRLPGADSEG